MKSKIYIFIILIIFPIIYNFDNKINDNYIIKMLIKKHNITDYEFQIINLKKMIYYAIYFNYHDYHYYNIISFIESKISFMNDIKIIYNNKSLEKKIYDFLLEINKIYMNEYYGNILDKKYYKDFENIINKNFKSL